MSATTTAARFPADPVAAGTKPLATEKLKASVERMVGGPVEACDSYTADVVAQPGFHGLIAAADLAYQGHYPLVLTPDAVWLSIAQGLAQHVANNAGQLRKQLVRHDGTPTIVVRRDDFVLGSPENPWAEVWPAFRKQIKRFLVAGVQRLVLCDFSTSGPAEVAASEVVLMGCVGSYFNYEVHTRCGIPEVILEGTLADWQKVHRRAKRLARFGLGWWTGRLTEITGQLLAAARGDVDGAFWSGLYKKANASGGPYVSGWLVQLLPLCRRRDYRRGDNGRYELLGIRTDEPNPLLQKPLLGEGLSAFGGVKHERLPSSASLVPFVWEYLGRRLEYQFLAGTLAVTQDPRTLAVRPRVGWAVRPAPTA